VGSELCDFEYFKRNGEDDKVDDDAKAEPDVPGNVEVETIVVEDVGVEIAGKGDAVEEP